MQVACVSLVIMAVTCGGQRAHATGRVQSQMQVLALVVLMQRKVEVSCGLHTVQRPTSGDGWCWCGCWEGCVLSAILSSVLMACCISAWCVGTGWERAASSLQVCSAGVLAVSCHPLVLPGQ